MKKKIFNKLAFRLILLILSSILISMAISFFIGNGFSISIQNEYIYISWYNSNIPGVISIAKDPYIQGQALLREFNFYSLLMVLFPVIIFFMIFLTVINKRIKYLEYITRSLSEIKNEKYLKKLDVIGKDEISELAKGINIMSERLKENYEKEKKNEEAKNELIVAVSHDLKTPLTSIIGYLDLLNDNKYDYSEEQKAYLDIAYKKSLDLKKLTEELFEYTKLANDYIELEKIKFNISILLNQLIGEYTQFFNEKGIDVKIENPFSEINCEIDIQKIIRVFENLIKNAEKYSYPGSKFKITVEREPNIVKFIFENEGDKIEKEDLEKIFEKMYRLDKARNSENEGSGLGLAISRKIVELHGGKLWAECNENKISFNMTLPI
ncbi:HAMP domain-containing sensor histidine kinase [Clostridium sp. LIBA-8841]|uniref:HAMP domain-containing sensor histidine kinase n=1 Tax=Clostridium sp. LIBA-8841 TaxID=2987530 RepID=UPI002AC62804|nr:HAMP domain-containing sensor histidine kinase [Clostridium sp. LIBA-8841]MDZ5254406.1 HAMP domain-containing histidine kinase [Clostridium sp. LIBA-8841]